MKAHLKDLLLDSKMEYLMVWNLVRCLVEKLALEMANSLGHVMEETIWMDLMMELPK